MTCDDMYTVVPQNWPKMLYLTDLL